MASIRIVLDPEQEGGLGEPFASAHLKGTLIHLADDAEVVISGLKDGMQTGKPSMMFGFVLPDGRPVIVETSWRLFAMAFWNFAQRFGDEKPDLSGMAVQYDPTGSGGRVQLDVISDDQQPFFDCELCPASFRSEKTGVEGSEEVAQFIHRHFREKHPDWTPPT
jgi:hypothetical protein